ncbi:MAG: rhodanese-like domain-containing protein [Streptosporangiaceae bacterium]
MFERPIPETDAREVPGGAYLLDVREPDEWEAGHAPDAVHVPLGTLPARAGEVPREREVYVVCRSGGRSAQAAAYLHAQGCDARNVGGGMQAWAAAGRPMVSDSEAPPTVA